MTIVGLKMINKRNFLCDLIYCCNEMYGIITIWLCYLSALILCNAELKGFDIFRFEHR